MYQCLQTRVAIWLPAKFNYPHNLKTMKKIVHRFAESDAYDDK